MHPFQIVNSKIDGYKIFRRDSSKFGDALMFHINEGIPCKVVILYHLM